MLLGKFENLRTRDKNFIVLRDNRSEAIYTFCKSLYIRMEYYTLILTMPNDNDFYFSIDGGMDNNKNFVDSRNSLLDTIRRTSEGQMIVTGISIGNKGANPGTVISMMQKTSPLNMMEVFVKGVEVETCSIYLRAIEKFSKNSPYILPIAFTSKRRDNQNFETYKECNKINIKLRMNKRYKKELYNVG